MSQQQDVKELAQAFQRLAQHPPIPLTLSPEAGFLLLAQLQLAMRHPANTGPGSETIRTFAIELQQRLVELEPDLQAVLEKGWHPEFDVKQPTDSPRLNYQRLPLDIQQEVVANAIALRMACQSLSTASGVPLEAWITEFSEEANKLVDQMSAETIVKQMVTLDTVREGKSP
ncbi:MAG: hypothetical protein LDL41_07490 [Coleofasciculus sp. S288]|nr:hypothetical protein [Coleofasciculus sp. S288]